MMKMNKKQFLFHSDMKNKSRGSNPLNIARLLLQLRYLLLSFIFITFSHSEMNKRKMRSSLHVHLQLNVMDVLEKTRILYTAPKN